MSRHPFDLLMELETDFIRLDCAALHLARDFYPELSMPAYLERLDVLAARVGAQRPGLSAPLRYEALRRVLVRECGLRGNKRAYFAPENSFLNCVLETGRGIPISLSIIWVEVGRRLNWPVAGVALPGHFLVRIDDHERFVLADPFHGGRSLSVDDCQQIVSDSFQGRVPFSPEFLRPAHKRGVLLRLLRNLRNIYMSRNDWPHVAEILRRMAAVEPGNGRHLQDLAAVCWRRGDVRGACAHLELYLHRVPDAHDSKLVERNLRQMHAALLALN
ncbi:MAG: transglutaminase-like domain-containing protein [Planctomycetota bacterium]